MSQSHAADVITPVEESFQKTQRKLVKKTGISRTYAGSLGWVGLHFHARCLRSIRTPPPHPQHRLTNVGRRSGKWKGHAK